MRKTFGLTGAICLFFAAASQAPAAAILPGTYQLHNHPDGNARPPLYGLRLDELYNVTGSNDIFTFDFDHASSSMTMVYNNVAGTIHISGITFGGRDTGTSYANDAYRGLYSVDFLYNVGVGPVPGDDDVWVVNAANNINKGSITPLTAGHPQQNTATILGDVRNGSGMSFRLGDENNDLGHRGYNGISGWGWLSVNGNNHAGSANDFLFTAVLIPEPTTLALAAFGLVGLIRRRR